MIKFVNFLLSNVYSSIEIDEEIVIDAFKQTLKDVKFHYVTEMIEVIQLALLKEKVKNAIDVKFMTEKEKRELL